MWNSYKTLQTYTYSRKSFVASLWKCSNLVLRTKFLKSEYGYFGKKQEINSAPINQCENVIEFNATEVDFYPRTRSPKLNSHNQFDSFLIFVQFHKLWGKTQFIHLFFIIPFGSTLMFRRRKRFSKLHCGSKILLKFWLSLLRPGDGISAPFRFVRLPHNPKAKETQGRTQNQRSLHLLKNLFPLLVFPRKK